jgi:hypothetical protein
LKFLNDFGKQLNKQKHSFLFYAIGKKAFVNKLKQLFLGKNKNITFQKKRFSQQETLKMYAESETIVDLVRDNQTGLSFRIFEAIGLQKNVITNNKTIISYDIYDSGKISYLDDLYKLNKVSFNKENYPYNITKKYSLDNFIKNIFQL